MSSVKMLCSFCAKSQDEVCKLIAGPGIAVCNECVALCITVCAEVLPAIDRHAADALAVKIACPPPMGASSPFTPEQEARVREIVREEIVTAEAARHLAVTPISAAAARILAGAVVSSASSEPDDARDPQMRSLPEYRADHE